MSVNPRDVPCRSCGQISTVCETAPEDVEPQDDFPAEVFGDFWFVPEGKPCDGPRITHCPNCGTELLPV